MHFEGLVRREKVRLRDWRAKRVVVVVVVFVVLVLGFPLEKDNEGLKEMAGESMAVANWR